MVKKIQGLYEVDDGTFWWLLARVELARFRKGEKRGS